MSSFNFLMSLNKNTFRFVRFTTKQSCVKAVQELNQWSFHGNPLIVDLAKDTKDRIKIGKILFY